MTINRADLAQTDLSDVDSGEAIQPVCPGDVLRADFMEPLGLTAYALAREINVPANRVTAIIKGERAISAETAILLARRFETSAEFWMNLQTAHDLEEAGYKIGLARAAFGETGATIEANNLATRKALHHQLDIYEAGRVHMRVDGQSVSVEHLLTDILRRIDLVEQSDKTMVTRAGAAVVDRAQPNKAPALDEQQEGSHPAVAGPDRAA